MTDFYSQETIPVLKQVPFGRTKLQISPVVVDCKVADLKLVDQYNEREKVRLFAMLKHCYDNGLRTFDVTRDNGILLGGFLCKYKIDPKTVVAISRIDIPSPYDPEYQLAKELKLTQKEGYLRTYLFKRVKGLLYGLGKHLDILQISNFDPDLSKEELLGSLHELVARGDVRYISVRASTMQEFQEWQDLAKSHQWPGFAGWQLTFGLSGGREEDEKLRFARQHGIGLLTWVASDGGVGGNAVEKTSKPAGPRRRSGSVDLSMLDDKQRAAFERLMALAERKKRSRTAVLSARALAMGCHPVVGCSSMEHVEQALQIPQIELTPEEIASLEVHLA